MEAKSDTGLSSLNKPQIHKLSLRLHPAQETVFNHPARFKFLMAGRRFGKTRLVIYSILKAAEKPMSKIWYVAPFKNQAEEIAWVDFVSIIPPQVLERAIETKLLFEFKNGSRVNLKGADKDKLRGPGLDYLAVDEAQDLKPNVFHKTLFPMLTGKQGRAMLIGTKKESNWFREEWKRVHSGAVPDAAAFYFPSESNPTIPLDEWRVQRGAVGEANWRDEFVSDPLSEEGGSNELKFPEFSRSKIAVAQFQIPSHWKCYRGFDWGMSHRSVCLWSARNPETGVIHIYDEWCGTGGSVEFQAKEIIARTGPRKIEATIADPSCFRRESDGLSIADRFRRLGVPMIQGRREDAEGLGVSIVKHHFLPVEGPPKISMASHLSCLMNELEKVKWESKTGDDHTDALRYLLVFLNSVSWERGEEIPLNGVVEDGDFLVSYKDGVQIGISHRLRRGLPSGHKFNELGEVLT